jgi:AhpC/TSA family
VSAAWIAVIAALWLLVILVTLAVVGTIRRTAGVLEAAEEQLRHGLSFGGGLPAGSRVPAFEGRLADGSRFEADDLDGSTVLLFLSGGCAPCLQLAAELSEVVGTFDHELLVVLRDESDAEQLGLDSKLPLLFQPDGSVAQAFQTSATPHAFLLQDGLIRAVGHPNTLEALNGLRPLARREASNDLHATAAVPARSDDVLLHMSGRGLVLHVSRPHRGTLLSRAVLRRQAGLKESGALSSA